MYPIFISDDPDAEEVIGSLPGQKRWGVNKLEGFLGPLVKQGLKSVILFGVPMRMEKVCRIRLIPKADIPGRVRHHRRHRRHPRRPRSEAPDRAVPSTLPRL